MIITQFSFAQTDDANAFLKENEKNLTTNGMRVLESGYVFITGNDVAPDEIMKATLLSKVDALLNSMYDEIIMAKVLLSFWTSKNLLKRGGAEKQENTQAQVFKYEEKITDVTAQIRHLRTMRTEIESGKLTV